MRYVTLGNVMKCCCRDIEGT